MMVPAQQEQGEGSANPTDPQHTPTITQPSLSQPQKKHKPMNPKKKDTEIPQSSVPSDSVADEAVNEENVSKHSNDLLLSSEDSTQLQELMELCTNLQKKVLDLETSKTSQAKEIASLKRRVKKLEMKGGKRTHRLKRLHKVGRSARVVSTDDEASLGDQEDASKSRRKIHDIDANEDITLENVHDAEMFDVNDLHDDEVFVEKEVPVKEVSTADPVTTAGEVVTTANVAAVTTAATTTTTAITRPKAKGLVIQEQEQASTPITSLKDKGKGIMELFDKAMKRVNIFVDMNTELVESTEKEKSSNKFNAEIALESSSKRASDELEQEKAKKQKVDDDQETAELQKLMEVVSEEEGVAIDVIPLATKPPSIVDYKIIKEGKISIYQIIRVDGSSKRYSAVIHMLRSFDREDLETLWKIVKARHGYTRPEEGYERVL
ncbi:hypothetical protein Tco_0164297 [Tanacetum coccineum]